jgi:hypothetical protein
LTRILKILVKILEVDGGAVYTVLILIAKKTEKRANL